MVQKKKHLHNKSNIYLLYNIHGTELLIIKWKWKPNYWKFLDSIRQNNSLIFEGINFKFELLELFIDINSKVFKKRYRDGEFFQIFQSNEDIIKKYISPDFSYSIVYKDFKSKSKEQRNEGMETLFNLFEQETCNK